MQYTVPYIFSRQQMTVCKVLFVKKLYMLWGELNTSQFQQLSIQPVIPSVFAYFICIFYYIEYFLIWPRFLQQLDTINQVTQFLYLRTWRTWLTDRWEIPWRCKHLRPLSSLDSNPLIIFASSFFIFKSLRISLIQGKNACGRAQ